MIFNRKTFAFICFIILISLFSLTSWSRAGGGCFTKGTLVTTPSGSIQIEKLKFGDQILGFDNSGKVIGSKVEELITHQQNHYFIIKIKSKTLKEEVHVTGEHPFYVGNGQFKKVEDLNKGEYIYQLQNNGLSPVQIKSIIRIKTNITVYNIKTSKPHTYSAENIAVHNKGREDQDGVEINSPSTDVSGDDSGSSIIMIVVILLFLYIILNSLYRENDRSLTKTTSYIVKGIGTLIVLALSNFKQIILGLLQRRFDDIKEDFNLPDNTINTDSYELDHFYSRRKIEAKSINTLKLINFLAKQDESLQADYLLSVVRNIFNTLQCAWSERDLSSIKQMIMPEIYLQYTSQLEGLIRNNEINKIDDLSILSIDLVNIRYMEKKNDREFTALISASARDYYIDTETGAYIRGDTKSSKFQEFWTFQYQKDTWLLREVEQTTASSYLHDENFCELFTDGQITKIYRDKVDHLGKSGPAFSKGAQTKITNVERMSNFLAEKDKNWQKGKMESEARSIFTNVYMAFEAGSLSSNTQEKLFPNLVDDFIENIHVWKTSCK